MRIELQNITKTYEDTKSRVFQDFNLVIDKGEFVVLTGKNGIGKSTLLKLLLMDTRADSGGIQVGDYNLAEMSAADIPYYRRKLGVVFQDFRLVETKSVYGNIELAREVVGGKKKDSGRVIASICSFLGISDLYRRYPRQLSGGEKQKVCLARALVNYPSLLLADEPTGNLSLEESKEIMKLFEMIHRQGVTVIIATHDMESIRGIHHREISLDYLEG